MPFTLLWEAVTVSFPSAATMALGAAFLAIVYLIPDGVTGLVERIAARRRA